MRINPVILNQLLRVFQPHAEHEESKSMNVKKRDSFILPDCLNDKNFNDPNLTKVGHWMRFGLDSIKFNLRKDRTEALEATKPFQVERFDPIAEVLIE